MADDKILKIDELNESNYTLWEWQIRSYLRARNLEKAIEEKPVVKDDNGIEISQVPTTEEQQVERKAFALIISSLSQTNKLKVLDCETSHEIWKRLASTYTNKTSYESQALLGKLHSYKIESASKVSEAISDMQCIVTKLKLYDESVSEKMFMSILLNALPESFRDFLRQWRYIDEKQRNLNNLISQLNVEVESHSNEDKAFLARKKFGGRGRPGDGRRTIICYNCGKPGHIARECRSGKSNQDPNSDDPNNNKTVAFMAREKRMATEWVVDTGATSHITSDKQLFSGLRKLQFGRSIELGDGHEIEAAGIGDIRFSDETIDEALYVPEAGDNLFSLGRAADNGIHGVYNREYITMCKNGRELARAHRSEGIWKLRMGDKAERALIATSSDWHKKLGHVSEETVARMANSKAIKGMKMDYSKARCVDCALGKCTKNSHPSRTSAKAMKPGQVLHIDTCGPITPTTTAGTRYFVLCKDEYSRYNKVIFADCKTTISNSVKQLITQSELETGNRTLKICTDNGTEFVNSNLGNWLQDRGINHQRSVAYGHEQNGFIEREIRTIEESARALLNSAGFKNIMWAEAVNTAVYLSNRVLKKNNVVTAYELWFNRVPDLSNLLIFGQYVVCHTPKEKRIGKQSKFDNTGQVMKFVGYTDRHNTYRVYDEITGKVALSCDVTPLDDNHANHQTIETPGPSHIDGNSTSDEEIEVENVAEDHRNFNISNPRSPEAEWDDDPATTELGRPNNNNESFHSTSANHEEEIDGINDDADVNSPDSSSATNNVDSGQVLPTIDYEDRQTTRPKTVRQPSIQPLNPGYLRGEKRANIDEASIPRKLYIMNKPPPVIEGKRKTTNIFSREKAKLAIEHSDTDPETFEEAMQRPDKEKWVAAMKEELNSMDKNEVWDLVPRPTTNIVSNKWVFKRKYDTNGNVTRYKARLVARGFSQKYGIDYHETYSPVANTMFIRLLLAYAAVEQLELSIFDVKTAFLYGTLDEDIYMEQPMGFIEPGNKVCKLKRSLYGLKQAPRQWCRRFSDFLTKLNLVSSVNDNCIFYSKKPLLIIAIYVDDGLILARDKRLVQSVIKTLSDEFEIHVMDNSSYLGFNIERGRDNSVIIHQSNYIDKILKKFKMINGTAQDNPSLAKMPDDNDEPLENNTPFAEAVGSLMYAAVTTRIDISHAVGKVSRSLASPTIAAWKAVKKIFRYLRDKESLAIEYAKNKHQGLQVYCDSDFAGDETTHRSTSGSVYLFGGAPIEWKSRRQPLITLSSTEAEFVSLCSTVKRTIEIRKFAIELGLIDDSPTRIFCDNESAIRIALDEKSSHRTRHMSVQASYPREQIERGEVTVEHIATHKQLADILTKPIPTKQFINNRNQLMSSIIKVTLALIIMMTLVRISESTEFHKVSPILWSRTEHRAYDEPVEYEIQYRLINPCRLVGVPPDPHADPFTNKTASILYRKLLEECNTAFESQVLHKLRMFVDTRPNQIYGKRDIIGSATTFFTGICVGNLLMTIWDFFDPNSYRNQMVRAQQDLHMKQFMIDSLSDRLNSTYHFNDKMINQLDHIMSSVSANTAELRMFMNVLPSFTIKSAQLVTRMHEASSDIDQMIIKAATGQLAVREANRFFNLTQLQDVRDEETRIHDVKFNEQFKTFDFTFSVKPRSKTIHIYRVHAISHWVNVTTEPVYVEYSGKKLVLYNSTSNCVVGLEDTTDSLIDDECLMDHHVDPSANNWNMKFNTSAFGTTKIAPEVYRTLDSAYVYCYPGTVTIGDGKMSEKCPPYVFKLKYNKNLIIDGLPFKAHKQKLVLANNSMNEYMDSIDKNHFHPEPMSYSEADLVDQIKSLRKMNQELMKPIWYPMISHEFIKLESPAWSISISLLVLIAAITGAYLISRYRSTESVTDSRRHSSQSYTPEMIRMLPSGNNGTIYIEQPGQSTIVARPAPPIPL